MKKYLIVLMIAAFVLTAVPGGCGGDKGKAEELMNNGDQILSDINAQYVEIGNKAHTLVNEYSQGINTEPMGVKAKTDEIKGLISEGESDAGEAMGDYGGILQLQGVPDYALYAELRLEILNRLQQAGGIFGQTLAIIDASITTGQAPDIAQLAALASQLENLGIEMAALDQQAKDFKAGKKL